MESRVSAQRFLPMLSPSVGEEASSPRCPPNQTADEPTSHQYLSTDLLILLCTASTCTPSCHHRSMSQQPVLMQLIHFTP